jgi:prepilin-type N-terminal cleavage/methylation domain-containing protein
MAGRRGFTLVELLVAVMILAMVLTTLYAAYTGTFRTALATEEDDALHGMARGMFLRLIRDLGGIVPYNGAMVFIAQPGGGGGRVSAAGLPVVRPSGLFSGGRGWRGGLHCL